MGIQSAVLVAGSWDLSDPGSREAKNDVEGRLERRPVSAPNSGNEPIVRRMLDHDKAGAIHLVAASSRQETDE
jgi:hypothetical protein